MGEVHGYEFSQSEPSGGENGLTPIHRRIHCVATPGTTETDNELDEIDIENFLDTLAEIAMSVARRRQLEL